MSTIKSSDEHLTLNADGSGKAIKLQNNGTDAVEVSNGATYVKGALYPQVAVRMSDSKAITFGTASDVEMLGSSLGTDINIKSTRLRVMNNLTELARFDNDGIKFNGDTSSSNALDDYEEGTWTPTLSGNISATPINFTYTKIGRLVHITGYLSSFSGSTLSASSFSISGLPYSGNVNFNMADLWSHSTGGFDAHCYLTGGGSSMNVRDRDNRNIATTGISELSVQMTYITA